MDNIVTSFEDLEKVYQFAKERNLEEIRFEFIMSALFPNIYKNIKDRIALAHTQGYYDGLQTKGIDYIYCDDNAKEYIKMQTEKAQE